MFSGKFKLSVLAFYLCKSQKIHICSYIIIRERAKKIKSYSDFVGVLDPDLNIQLLVGVFFDYFPIWKLRFKFGLHCGLTARKFLV